MIGSWPVTFCERALGESESRCLELTSCVSSSVPSPAGSSTDDDSSWFSWGSCGAGVVVVDVSWPGLGRRFSRAPGLMTGLGPVVGSLERTVVLGAVVATSCVVSFGVSWLSSLAFGAVVVGLPRRRLMFSLLNVGLDIPADAFGVDVVVATTDLVPVPELPRNRPRVLEGRSACTELELSFCTASSSTAAVGFWPGRGLLKPPPLEPLAPKRPRVRCVDSTVASVVVVLPLPFDLNLPKESTGSARG